MRNTILRSILKKTKAVELVDLVFIFEFKGQIYIEGRMIQKIMELSGYGEEYKDDIAAELWEKIPDHLYNEYKNKIRSLDF